MKKFSILLLFIICGCTNNGKQQEIDPKAFGYEISYNLISNSFAYAKNIVELEDGLLYYQNNTNNDDSISGNLIYIKDNNYQLVNANVGNKCDFDHLSSCTGSFDEQLRIENLNYYMGKLYYIFKEFDEENEVSYYYLGRCNLDGESKEKLVKLNYEVKTGDSISILLTFHKGYVYYSFGDNVLNAISLETMEDEVVANFNDECNIVSVYIYNDTAFIYAQYFDNQGSSITDAIIKVDLLNHDYELFQKNLRPYFIDEKNIICVIDQATYLYNIENKTTKQLLNTYSTYKISTDEFYLLDNSDENIENAGIYLFDKQGNQLDYTPCYDFHFGFGIIDNKYYFMDNDQLMYYEIIDGKFQERYTFEFK